MVRKPRVSHKCVAQKKLRAGVVYLCKDKENGDIVAIKAFLKADENPAVRASFESRVRSRHLSVCAQILKSAVREAAMLKIGAGFEHLVQMHSAYRSDSGR